MHPVLKIFMIVAAAALLVAVVLALTWRWIMLRVLRKMADATESRLATTIEPHASRAGLQLNGVSDERLRAKYLADIDLVARLMDRLIPLPIVGGIGLDALFGLLPVAGDLLSLGFSTVIVFRAAQLGVPASVMSRLISIQITDLLVGAVPLIGDLADVAYQADIRSAAVIRQWVSAQTQRRVVP